MKKKIKLFSLLILAVIFMPKGVFAKDIVIDFSKIFDATNKYNTNISERQEAALGYLCDSDYNMNYFCHDYTNKIIKDADGKTLIDYSDEKLNIADDVTSEDNIEVNITLNDNDNSYEYLEGYDKIIVKFGTPIPFTGFLYYEFENIDDIYDLSYFERQLLINEFLRFSEDYNLMLYDAENSDFYSLLEKKLFHLGEANDNWKITLAQDLTEDDNIFYPFSDEELEKLNSQTSNIFSENNIEGVEFHFSDKPGTGANPITSSGNTQVLKVPNTAEKIPSILYIGSALLVIVGTATIYHTIKKES